MAMDDEDMDATRVLPQGAAGLRELLIGAGHPRAATMVQLHEIWEQLVGAQLATHVQPAVLQGELLVLSVDSPVWAQELHFNKHTLLQRIQKQTGIVVTDLRTRVGHDR